MKNKDLVQLSQTLNQVSGIKGKEFAYAVFKNKNLIEQEIKIFEQLRKDPHPDFQNYENERMIVCINYSQKDDNGNPVIENNQYKIEDWVGFQEDMKELADKYKDVIEDMENTRKEYEDFMEKESSIELITVKFENLPNDIDAITLERLKFMID
jgi:hypothetical protein